MKAFGIVATCALFALPLVVACANNEEDLPAGTQPQSAYGATNAQPGSFDMAIDRIANARCDYEQNCNNIGANEDYPTRDACTNKAKVDLASDLRPNQCPAGIDRQQVDSCVAELHSEHCGNVLDTVSRATACRTSKLCVH